MKILVISYSLTGNNEALATSIAKEFSAEHIKISECKPRNMSSIFFDIVFNRIPRINTVSNKVEDYEFVIFVCPVWMGQVATPFRALFKQFKSGLKQYAFVSVSGGADGKNPKLADELHQRIGKPPRAIINLHIAELMPPEPKPRRKNTMAYRLNDKEVKTLSDTAVKTLREIIDL